MKAIKNFLIDFGITLLISLPCFFLCDMIGEKGVVDWLDLQLGLGGVSILLLVSYLLFARHDKESKGAKIINTMTLLAIVATVIYGAFMLLEWLFPDNTDSGFKGNWVQWFPVSISMSVFLYMQNKRRVQSYKNEKNLVVATECNDMTEAGKICAMLEEKGIKALVADKKSPMYIKNESNAKVQVQVLGHDLEKAKELIK